MGRILKATPVLIRSSVAAEVAASERFLRRRLAKTAVRTHPPDADHYGNRWAKRRDKLSIVTSRSS